MRGVAFDTTLLTTPSVLQHIAPGYLRPSGTHKQCLRADGYGTLDTRTHTHTHKQTTFACLAGHCARLIQHLLQVGDLLVLGCVLPA